MEKRQLKMQFNKSKSGSISPRLPIPITWVQELNITQEDREIVLSLLKDAIIIRKKDDSIAPLDATIEERDKNMSFNKSGSGSLNARVILPATWMQNLEITLEDRDVEIALEDNIITIQKQK